MSKHLEDALLAAADACGRCGSAVGNCGHLAGDVRARDAHRFVVTHFGGCRKRAAEWLSSDPDADA